MRLADQLDGVVLGDRDQIGDHELLDADEVVAPSATLVETGRGPLADRRSRLLAGHHRRGDAVQTLPFGALGPQAVERREQPARARVPRSDAAIRN